MEIFRTLCAERNNGDEDRKMPKSEDADTQVQAREIWVGTFHFKLLLSLIFNRVCFSTS